MKDLGTENADWTEGSTEKDYSVTWDELIKKTGRSKPTLITWMRPAINWGMIIEEESRGKIPTRFRPGTSISRAETKSVLPSIEELAEKFPSLAKDFKVVDPLTGKFVKLENGKLVELEKK